MKTENGCAALLGGILLIVVVLIMWLIWGRTDVIALYTGGAALIVATAAIMRAFS